ncbi:MAG TPA: hypothetical protein VFN48_08835 [Solirubrobacteraceae bacterium]|nr:hypothetical protein [Solirubrobacteraceae bacterium]
MAARLRVDARLALGVLILAVALLRYLPLANNGWFVDDNLYLALAHSNGLTLSWLFNPVLDHFGILYRFAFNVFVHLMPISWRWTLLADLILLGAAMVLLDRCLALLLDSRWAPLLISGAFGLSILLVEPLQWVSSGLQSFPTLVGDLLCLYAYLRYLEDRAPGHIAMAAAGVVFGLLFYEKASFMLGYLVLVRLGFLAPELSVRRVVAIARSEWRFWAGLLAVLILWFIGEEASGAGGTLISPSLSAWVTFWRILWVQTLVPGLFGLHLPETGLHGGQVIEAIGLEAVVLAGIIVSLVRKRAAWRAWVVLLIVVLANGILVGEERIVVLPPAVIAGDTRYLLDFAWLVPLCVALAFSPASSFWPRRSRLRAPLTVPGGPGGPGGARSGVLVAGTGLLALAYVVAAQLTTASLQRAWTGTNALVYEQRIQQQVAAYTHDGVPPVVADTTTPYEILPSIFAPYDHLSYLLGFYAPSAQVDGPLRGELVMADQLGNLQPAVPHVVESYRFGPRCLVAGVRPPLRYLSVRIPRSGQGPYYLLARYGAGTAGYLQYSGTAADPAITPDIYIGTTRHAGASLGYLGDTLPVHLTINLPPHSRLCLRTLAIATLAPR